MGSRFDLHTVIPFLPEVSDWFWAKSRFLHVDGGRVRSKAFVHAASLSFAILLFWTLWVTQELFAFYKLFSDEMGGIRQHFHRLWAVCGVVSRIAFQKYCGEIANFIFNKCEHFVGSRYLLIYSSTVGLCLVLDWWLEKRKSTKLH